MAYDFDIAYLKGNTILHVDPLSWLQFNKHQNKKNSVPDEEIYNISTKILEILQDPILSKSIKRNRWNNYSKAERRYGEERHKITMENGVICNRDVRVPPETVKDI